MDRYDVVIVGTGPAGMGAAFSLLEKKNLENITVTDIVREANINRGTFYAHFHSPYEVLSKIQEDMFSELTRTIESYKPEDIMLDPSPVFVRVSQFLISDIAYYKKLFRYTRVQEYLFDNKERIFRYFLNSEIAKSYFTTSETRREFISLLDFWLSGVFNIYYDAVLEKIPLRLDEVPQLLTKVVKVSAPQSLSFLKFFGLNYTAAESEEEK